MSNNQNINLNVNYALTTGNTDQDKFLFYFQPNILAKDCCCGCSLKTGVQIIALIFIASALSNFFSAFRMDSMIDLIFSGLSFSLYFIAGACIIYSTMCLSFIYAHTGYMIYALIFLFSFFDNVLVCLLIFLGVYSPFGADSFKGGIIFLAAMAIILAIHLYLVWVIFSYAIHLKHSRLRLIAGDITAQYEDVLKANSTYINNPLGGTGAVLTQPTNPIGHPLINQENAIPNSTTQMTINPVTATPMI